MPKHPVVPAAGRLPEMPEDCDEPASGRHYDVSEDCEEPASGRHYQMPRASGRHHVPGPATVRIVLAHCGIMGA